MSSVNGMYYYKLKNAPLYGGIPKDTVFNVKVDSVNGDPSANATESAFLELGKILSKPNTTYSFERQLGYKPKQPK